MGGEGAMMAAINSLKNNRKLLIKRKDTKALEGSYSSIELKEFPKATEAQLKAIKQRIQLQNRNYRIKLIVISGFIVIIIITFFIFYMY